MKNKNAESVCEALIHIIEYLNGVRHTIWFDNDAEILAIIKKSDGSFQRILVDTFKRFVIHYGFREVFMNPMRPNEKGTVEQAVRYMRRNLLVPLPSFDDFEEYNKELLDKCKDALKSEPPLLMAQQRRITLIKGIFDTFINHFSTFLLNCRFLK